MKVVLNVCYGGFGLSDEAMELYLTKTGQVPFYKIKLYGNSHYATEPFVGTKTNGKYLSYSSIERNDPVLVEIVETLGKKSWDQCAELKVVDIPKDVAWEIYEYDGNETIRERSRSWR